jgi:exosortase/archaeosortase family protein
MIKPPQLRFLAIMLGGAVLFWLVFRDGLLGTPLIALRAATAEAARIGLRITGIESLRLGTALYHSQGFAVEISRGCTGFVGAALLSLGVLAYPATSPRRMVGVTIVVPVFLTANLVRVIHLFHLGVSHSRFFPVAHQFLWQFGMVLIAVCMWSGWVAWADQQRQGITRVTH